MPRAVGACLLLGVWLSALATEVIRLNVAPGGFPPYTIVTPGQETGGLVLELLAVIAAKHGCQIRTLELPRNWVESMVLDDSLDPTPRAREWTKQPERFLFTEPMVEVHDVVFSRRAAPLRTSAAIANELSGLWVIRNEGWSEVLVFSRKEVDSYEYRLMFGRRWSG